MDRTKTQQAEQKPITDRGRLRRIKLKGGTSRRSPSSIPTVSKDQYLETQDRVHGAISKGTGALHLMIGSILAGAKTFFQRSFLSILAILILITGMALAAESYLVVAGVLPGPIIPKPGVGFSAATGNLERIIQTFTFWNWFWFALVGFSAIAVQTVQWASVRFIEAQRRIAATGGKLQLNGFGLIVFILFVAGLWWLDLQIITSAYLRTGFSIGGVLVWFWAAFPSEIAESFFALQRSLPDEASKK